jgi:hypothetical protein
MRIDTLTALILSVFLLTACGAAPTFDGSVAPNTTGAEGNNNGIANSKNASSVKSSGVKSSGAVNSSALNNGAKSSAIGLASSSKLRASSASSALVVSSSVPRVLSSAAASSSLSRKTTSHNVGKNCLSCHKVGGDGAKFAVFSAAGSIYQSNGAPQANALVRLYVPGTNTLAASLGTDASGNFYTSDAVAGLPSGAGVQAEVEGSGGKKINMSDTVKNGGCNTCHNGAVTNKITMD